MPLPALAGAAGGLAAGAAGSDLGGTAKQFGQAAIQKWLDGVKLSLLPLSIAIWPLFVLLAMIIIELLLPIIGRFFGLEWRIPLWRAVLYIFVLLIAFTVLAIVFGLILYIIDDPGKACAELGGEFFGTLGKTGGWIAGKLGFCSALNELFSAILS